VAIIEAQRLRKEFRVAKRRAGSWGALQALFAPAHSLTVAVDDISFAVAAGEFVGYIGPNGAGKSTTIKMLTGILVPSGGRVLVRGLEPHRSRVENARHIGVVFGQRTQLWWDLPTMESFELLRRMYRVPADRYQRNLVLFTDMLGLGEFMRTPVRQLSLGQRMRADIAAALLHDPPLLFLDEPTIGLDVVAKVRIRDFITQINREHNVTVLLTTHDISDIEKLCNRTLLIDHGRIVFDGDLADLRERYGRYRTLVVELEGRYDALDVPGAEVVRAQEGRRFWLRFDRREVTASQLIARVSERYQVRDLAVEEPEIESIVARIYQEGMQAPPG